MARTLQQKYQAALERRGETVVRKTAKYISMTRAKGGFYFLGGAGSVRYGRSKTHSIPASDNWKAALLEDMTGII